jgi:integrase
LLDVERNKLSAEYAPWMQRLSDFAKETCLSQGDLLRLTEDMIDRNAGVIFLEGGRGKTKLEQTPPLTVHARQILDEIKAERRSGAAVTNVNGLIFTNADGRPITKGQIDYQLERALKNTGVKKFTLQREDIAKAFGVELEMATEIATEQRTANRKYFKSLLEKEGARWCRWSSKPVWGS